MLADDAHGGSEHDHEGDGDHRVDCINATIPARWRAALSPASSPAGARSAGGRARRRRVAGPAAAAGAELRERARDAEGLLTHAHRPRRRRRCSTPARSCARSPTTRSASTTSTSRRRAARGIAVGNTPDVLTDATADLAFALLLAAARRLPEAIAAVRGGRLADLGARALAGRRGRTARRSAIIGMGRIGRAMAARARGFAMEVVLRSGRDRDEVARGARARRTSSRCTAR